MSDSERQQPKKEEGVSKTEHETLPSGADQITITRINKEGKVITTTGVKESPTAPILPLDNRSI